MQGRDLFAPAPSAAPLVAEAARELQVMALDERWKLIRTRQSFRYVDAFEREAGAVELYDLEAEPRRARESDRRAPGRRRPPGQRPRRLARRASGGRRGPGPGLAGPGDPSGASAAPWGTSNERRQHDRQLRGLRRRLQGRPTSRSTTSASGRRRPRAASSGSACTSRARSCCGRSRRSSAARPGGRGRAPRPPAAEARGVRRRALRRPAHGAAGRDERTIEFGETHVFVGPRYVVSVRHGASRRTPRCARAARRTPHLLRRARASCSTPSWTSSSTTTSRSSTQLEERAREARGGDLRRDVDRDDDRAHLRAEARADRAQARRLAAGRGLQPPVALRPRAHRRRRAAVLPRRLRPRGAHQRERRQPARAPDQRRSRPTCR